LLSNIRNSYYTNWNFCTTFVLGVTVTDEKN